MDDGPICGGRNDGDIADPNEGADASKLETPGNGSVGTGDALNPNEGMAGEPSSKLGMPSSYVEGAENEAEEPNMEKPGSCGDINDPNGGTTDPLDAGNGGGIDNPHSGPVQTPGE